MKKVYLKKNTKSAKAQNEGEHYRFISAFDASGGDFQEHENKPFYFFFDFGHPYKLSDRTEN